jgi:hypothetical protein
MVEGMSVMWLKSGARGLLNAGGHRATVKCGNDDYKDGQRGEAVSSQRSIEPMWLDESATTGNSG